MHLTGWALIVLGMIVGIVGLIADPIPLMGSIAFLLIVGGLVLSGRSRHAGRAAGE